MIEIRTEHLTARRLDRYRYICLLGGDLNVVEGKEFGADSCRCQIVQSAVSLARRVVTFERDLKFRTRWIISGFRIVLVYLSLSRNIISFLRKLSHMSPRRNTRGGRGTKWISATQRYWTATNYFCTVSWSVIPCSPVEEKSTQTTGKEHAEICLLVASLLINPSKMEVLYAPKTSANV